MPSVVSILLASIASWFQSHLPMKIEFITFERTPFGRYGIVEMPLYEGTSYAETTDRSHLRQWDSPASQTA
jgi:hypothetical protein